jgi:hypothetical protein
VHQTYVQSCPHLWLSLLERARLLSRVGYDHVHVMQTLSKGWVGFAGTGQAVLQRSLDCPWLSASMSNVYIVWIWTGSFARMYSTVSCWRLHHYCYNWSFPAPSTWCTPQGNFNSILGGGILFCLCGRMEYIFWEIAEVQACQLFPHAARLELAAGLLHGETTITWGYRNGGDAEACGLGT